MRVDPAVNQRVARSVNLSIIARDYGVVQEDLGATTGERTLLVDLEEMERRAHPIAEQEEDRDAPDHECVACRSSMHTPSDLDPTALCNGCAQAYAADTAPEILALITRIRELEALAGQALHHSDLPPKETAEGWAILGRGVVLP